MLVNGTERCNRLGTNRDGYTTWEKIVRAQRESLHGWGLGRDKGAIEPNTSALGEEPGGNIAVVISHARLHADMALPGYQMAKGVKRAIRFIRGIEVPQVFPLQAVLVFSSTPRAASGLYTIRQVK
jgi:hypothetical protein